MGIVVGILYGMYMYIQYLLGLLESGVPPKDNQDSIVNRLSSLGAHPAPVEDQLAAVQALLNSVDGCRWGPKLTPYHGGTATSPQSHYCWLGTRLQTMDGVRSCNKSLKLPVIMRMLVAS